MHHALPPTVLALFEDPKYKGDGLLGLPQSKGIKTATAYEISLNYIFLLPIVKAYPSKVRVVKC